MNIYQPQPGPGPHHARLGSLPAIPWTLKVFQIKSLCLHPQKSSVELRGHWKKRSEMPLAEAPTLRGSPGAGLQAQGRTEAVI